MAKVEVLNYRLRGEKAYQTVSFDTNDPSRYTSHLRTEDELKEICSSGVHTDFKIVSDILMVAPSLGAVSSCGDAQEYVFDKSLIDLLDWLVQNDAEILLDNGNSFKALALKVSSSTMTISAPYLKDDEWRSFVFMYISDMGLVSAPFTFVVDKEVPSEFMLKTGERFHYKGRDRLKYRYDGELLEAPMMQGAYLLSLPMLHYMAAKADMFSNIRELLRLIERNISILLGLSDKKSDKSKDYYQKRMAEGISMKRVGGKKPDYSEVLNEYFLKYVKPKEMTIEEVLVDLNAQDLPAWERTAKIILTDVFFKYTQPEDRLKYLSLSLRMLTQMETRLRLGLYRHRAYIYVNEVPFYVETLDVPVDRVTCYGGTSKDTYILKKG